MSNSNTPVGNLRDLLARLQLLRPVHFPNSYDTLGFKTTTEAKECWCRLQELRRKWEEAGPENIYRSSMNYERELTGFMSWMEKQTVSCGTSVPVYAWRMLSCVSVDGEASPDKYVLHYSRYFECAMVELTSGICAAIMGKPHRDAMDSAIGNMELVEMVPKGFAVYIAKVDIDTMSALCDILSLCTGVDDKEPADRIEVYKEALALCPQIGSTLRLHGMVNDFAANIAERLSSDLIGLHYAANHYNIAHALTASLFPKKDLKVDSLRELAQIAEQRELTFEEALALCETDFDKKQTMRAKVTNSTAPSTSSLSFASLS